MKRLLIYIIWFLLIISCSAEIVSDTAISIIKHDEKIQSINKTIYDVDFNNFTYKTRMDIYKITNKRYHKTGDFGFDELEINSISYLKYDDEIIAVVDFWHHYGGGSSCFDNHLHFFGIRNNMLYLYYEIEYGKAKDYKLDLKNKIIKVTVAKWMAGDPNSSPSKQDKVAISLKDKFPKIIKQTRMDFDEDY